MQSLVELQLLLEALGMSAILDCLRCGALYIQTSASMSLRHLCIDKLQPLVHVSMQCVYAYMFQVCADAIVVSSHVAPRHEWLDGRYTRVVQLAGLLSRTRKITFLI